MLFSKEIKSIVFIILCFTLVLISIDFIFNKTFKSIISSECI